MVASYRSHGRRSDRSDSCASSPGPAVPNGTWLPGRFGSAGDVDWYRFKLVVLARPDVLGDLAVGARMSSTGLHDKVTRLDAAGPTPEVLTGALAAGTYAVR